MDEKLLKIGEAAALLGVSVPTLRVWTDTGKIRANLVTSGGHRFYQKHDVERLMRPLLSLAQAWASAPGETALSSDLHCQTKDLFETRLRALQRDLATLPDLAGSFQLIVAVVGEIGNNAYDHNFGNWPDVQGIFFGYDVGKRYVVLADRGSGVLATLSRVKPSLTTDADALHTAFTEVLSGRAPEQRGNGLKFVRQIIRRYGWQLMFGSGKATLAYDQSKDDLVPVPATQDVRGTIAMMSFPAPLL